MRLEVNEGALTIEHPTGRGSRLPLVYGASLLLLAMTPMFGDAFGLPVPPWIIAGVLAFISVLAGMIATTLDSKVLVQLEGRLTFIPRTAEPSAGYRDSAARDELTFNDSRVSRSAIREVALGCDVIAPGEYEQKLWPLYIVLEDRVIFLGSMVDEDEAVRVLGLIAKTLGVPSRRLDESGTFDRGAAMRSAKISFAVHMAMIAVACVFMAAAPMSVVALIAPAMLAAFLWVSLRLARRRADAALDGEVAARFNLTERGAPRARVRVDPLEAEVHAVSDPGRENSGSLAIEPE